MRKLLVLVVCGLVHRVACSRMRFERAFHEPIFRHEAAIPGAVFKREHFFPREGIAPPEQILPQPAIMRAEPIFGNEPLVAHPPHHHGEEFLPNEQFVQGEPFVRPDPILRREAFIRREPLLRRDPFIRSEALIRGGRAGGIFRNEPNAYTFMVSQCPCQEQVAAPEAFFQVQQQQQPIVAHRVIFPKPLIKAQAYQPFVAFPRIQRFMRKSYKPVAENVHFAAPAAPVPEFNSFNGDPASYPGNFQNQAAANFQAQAAANFQTQAATNFQSPQQENTSEPSQSSPATVRNVPQMSNPLALAQVSSIC